MGLSELLTTASRRPGATVEALKVTDPRGITARSGLGGSVTGLG